MIIVNADGTKYRPGDDDAIDDTIIPSLRETFVYAQETKATYTEYMKDED